MKINNIEVEQYFYDLLSELDIEIDKCQEYFNIGCQPAHYNGKRNGLVLAKIKILEKLNKYMADK